MSDPLERVAKSSSTTSARDLRYALQNTAARLLPKERVSLCQRHRVPETEGVAVLKYGDGSTSYGNLQQCNSVWSCPVCAARISEERRIELQEVVNGARKEGLWVVHATFTMRHNRYSNLDDLILALSSKGAWGRLTSGRSWVSFTQKYGYVGRVVAKEVTHGSNGWHPHLHVLFVLCGTGWSVGVGQRDRNELHADLATLWLQALECYGLDGEKEFACHVTDHDGDVAEYVAKHGHLPRDVEARALESEALDKTEWSLAHEITKQVVKRSRSTAGRSPMALLYDASEGDQHAAKLWVQYANAFKGQRQLTISQSLRERFGVDQVDQVDQEEPEPELLLEILPALWRQVVRYQKRAELLQVARAGVDELRQWLHELDLPPALTNDQLAALTPPPPAAPGVFVDYNLGVVHLTGPPDCVIP